MNDVSTRNLTYEFPLPAQVPTGKQIRTFQRILREFRFGAASDFLVFLLSFDFCSWKDRKDSSRFLKKNKNLRYYCISLSESMMMKQN